MFVLEEIKKGGLTFSPSLFNKWQKPIKKYQPSEGRLLA